MIVMIHYYFIMITNNSRITNITMDAKKSLINKSSNNTQLVL